MPSLHSFSQAARRTSQATLLFFSFALPAHSQVATGKPAFGSFAGGPEAINLGNDNIFWTFPVLHKKGRGLDFNFDLGYNSSVFVPVSSGGTTTWQHSSTWGWDQLYYVGGPYLTFQTNIVGPAPCNPGSGDFTPNSIYVYTGWVLVDGTGAHAFSGTSSYDQHPSCPNPPPQPTGFTAVAGDGSGYKLVVSATAATVYTRDGKTLQLPENPINGAQNSTTIDRNGNKMTSSTTGAFTDTMGQSVLSANTTQPLTTTFSYSAPSGATATLSAKFTTYSVQTNFGCSGIIEYGANGTTSATLVNEIDLPDYNASTNPNARYVFTYEPTPGHTGFITGRLASVTVPTGGTISYTYTAGSSGHIDCTDGSTPGLQRQTPDGTWTYVRSQISGSHWQTVVTDPLSNQTVIDFQKDAASANVFETNRQVYQGSSSSGTLLQTIASCYNSAASPCTSTSITSPITQTSAVTKVPGSKNYQSKVTATYNQYGLVTEVDDYDFGLGAPPSTPLRKTVTTYASLGNIVSLPSSIVVKDSSNIVRSQVTYSYDQTTPSVPPGATPMHIAVSGSRGNLTTETYLTSGSNTISKTFTYYDTGMLKTAVDANGAGSTVTYNYPNATDTCGNAFPTSVSEPLSLTRSTTWNCVGGVQLTGTDENGKVTTTVYANDPFYWRPDSVTDPTGAVLNYCYGLRIGGSCNRNPNQRETYLTFNSGNSSVDTLSTLDSLGRSFLQQTRQTPSGTIFDTVETDYDSLGRRKKVTRPFSAAAGGTSSTAPGTSTTYDALNRPLAASDSGGGSISYSYSNNDAVTTVTSPAGENPKQHQLEYDGFGRLTSVCEISASSGSGSCVQSSAQTGFWTKYTFDTLSNLTGVNQNAQAATGNQQARSFVYDLSGRLTSETNPENGTTTYVYDTDATCGTSIGDLVKKTDAVGNVICAAYDMLHRPTQISYPSGPYSTNTPTKKFVYDSATVNGVAMSNAKGHIAEAYTCTTCPGTKITDEGFSYTPRGEVSDFYLSAPHSSTYYHLTQSYWAHGVLMQLSGLPGLPSITFGGTIGSTVGLDGEGRITQVTAGTGQNPVTGMNYNLYGSPPQITTTYGSSDSDVFSFDANTGRATKYQFNVNGQSDIGTLTWNANGSLKQLAITDAINSANTQTCNYTHDDFARIASVDCGAAKWQQNFGYDAFGNITKSVPPGGTGNSFQPTYNPTTNRFSTIPGCTVSYDSNGNVLNDCSHTYTWDANGNPLTVDGVGLTFDALDRMIEQNRSGSYTEIVYSPVGAKLALMNGSTLSKAFIPLPAGGEAVYSSSGLLYYGHSDHLGSIRLGTTPSRTMYFDFAHAPFGEIYANSGTLDPAFTGQRPDTVSGLYDFAAREYNNQGRWASPDPAGFAAADASDPQSWNRYAYVRNSPLLLVDPFGLDCVYLNDDGTLAGVARGDCNDGDEGYFVDGTVTGIVANDGQVSGVTLDYGEVAHPVGFDYNSSTTSANSYDDGTLPFTMPYNPVMSELTMLAEGPVGREAMKVDKLTTCGAEALLDEVPFSRYLGAHDPDPIGNKLRSAGKAISPSPDGKSFGIIPNNLPANGRRIATGLEWLGKPQWGEAVLAWSSKAAPLAGGFSKFLGLAGWGYMGVNASRNTSKCYQKPEEF